MHQRTLRWISYLLSRAKHRPDKKATEVRLVKLKNAVDKGFANIKGIRGQHVHEHTFEERAFDRAETAAYLASIIKERSKKKGLAALENLFLIEITTDWRKKGHDNILFLIYSYNDILGTLVKTINELEY